MLLPESLAKDIIEQNISWDRGQIFTVDDFLSTFTLHDSIWIGLHLDAGWDGNVTAILSLDPVWNKIEVLNPSQCAGWPILLILFPTVQSVKLDNYNDIGGLQRGISHVNSKVVNADKVETVIHDQYGGKIIMNHENPIKILCFTAEGELIDMLEKSRD